MNPLDILIMVIIGFCLIRGIFRGLIKEVSSIVGVLAGFYFAYSYYVHLAGLLSGWISNTGYRNILGFMIIFFAVAILVAAVAVIIKYVLKIVSLGWFDRICGSIFAVIKGVLIVSVIILILTTFLPRGTPLIKNSLLAPHVMMISEKMIKIVPPEMKQQFADKFAELKKSWHGKQ